jgi:hypothetical protein
MERTTRTRLVGGALLILAGILLLVARFVPEVRTLLDLEYAWPVIVIAVGAGLLVLGLLVGNPDLAVPASIVAGIGGILYWQALTNNYETWSFAWALIPAFVGVGVILSGLLGGQNRKGINDGIWLIVIGLTLFLVFGGLFGGLGVFGPYWPVLLIVLGVALLVRTLLQSGRR